MPPSTNRHLLVAQKLARVYPVRETSCVPEEVVLPPHSLDRKVAACGLPDAKILQIWCAPGSLFSPVELLFVGESVSSHHHPPRPWSIIMADITQPAHEQRTGPAHDQISLAQESDAISEVSTNKNFATALLTNSQDPSSNDDRFITTRTELWTYYVFYIGQSGLSLFNFAPTQFQNLLAQQAVNNGNGQCGGDGQPDCRLLFAGKERTVESIVLLSNGISFAIQAALLIAIGSTADYGNGRPLILILSTILSVGVSLGWLGVTKPDQWEIATGMYMAGLIAYQLVQTYYVAVFAGLSRDLPHMRQARQKLIEDSQIVSTTEGNDTDDKATTPAVEKQADSSSSADSDDRMTADKYSLLETMAMNRVSNISFTVCSVGELVVLAVIQGMLYGIHADRDEQSNTTALSAIVAFGGGIQILCSVPYFLAMRWRPGQPLPPGTNYLTAAVKQAFLAAKHLRRLRQTLIYLIFYFLFSDAFNTTVTVISTLQYSSFSYSATDSNILLIVGIAAQAVGIYGFWLIQKKWQLSTLTMFSAVVFFILLLQVWGFIGIFTQRFGFHNKWEF